MRARRSSWSIALVLVTAIGLLLTGCGDSQTSRRAWASSEGPVKVVVKPSVVRKPTDFRATIHNDGARTIYWGGCVYWNRWPSRSLPTARCITGALVRPHSSWRLSERAFPGFTTPARPGLYRLILVYEVGSPGAPAEYAFAGFTVAR